MKINTKPDLRLEGKKVPKGSPDQLTKQNYLRVKDHDAYKLFLEDSGKKSFTHTYTECAREDESMSIQTVKQTDQNAANR